MAFYLDPRKVRQSDKTSKFQKFAVGDIPDYPGIYECQNCGQEDVINRECTKLPPCAACKEKGHEWLLIARAQDADEKKKKK
jgi:hypothetical protein